jgi:hypothetical protein
MAFPTSPTNGQTYTNNGITYVYDAGMGVWETQGTTAGASPVSSVAGRTGVVTLTAADIAAGTFPGTVTGSTINATTLNVTTITALSSSITITSPTTFSSTITYGSSVQISSLGIGTAASGTAGEIRATNAITAYYSDGRLKTNVKRIENALSKVRRLSGVYYTGNDVAGKYGYNTTEQQVGFITQEWEKEMPEIVKPAPFDIGQNEDGSEYSISGENYKTMQYERASPLLLEAIKDLADELDVIKHHLGL